MHPKIEILHKFRNRRQPREVYPNFQKCFLGNFRSIPLSSRNFRNQFGWIVRFSEIQQFPYFLELFPLNYRTICRRFENFEIFSRMASAHVYTDTENFVRHSLRTALTQGSLLALDLISGQTCLSDGNPGNSYSKDKSCFREPIFILSIVIPKIADLTLE